VKDSQEFINHALEKHEYSRDSSSIKSELKIKNKEEDVIILPSKQTKRKADNTVTNSIVKRKHVIEKVEDYDTEDTPVADLIVDENDASEELVIDAEN